MSLLFADGAYVTMGAFHAVLVFVHTTDGLTIPILTDLLMNGGYGGCLFRRTGACGPRGVTGVGTMGNSEVIRDEFAVCIEPGVRG